MGRGVAAELCGSWLRRGVRGGKRWVEEVARERAGAACMDGGGGA